MTFGTLNLWLIKLDKKIVAEKKNLSFYR